LIRIKRRADETATAPRMTELSIARRPRPATAAPRLTTRRYTQWFLRQASIVFYLASALALTLAATLTFGLTSGMALASTATLVVLALLEYLIHRFAFHGAITARVWRFLHYSHHMQPNETTTILGPPQYTIPLILLTTIPLGLIVGGAPGAGAAVAAGMWLLLVYEYAHGYSHMVAEPGSGYGRMLRHLHMLHHFHNEKGNFGVTSPVFDLVFGTYYVDPAKVARCPTALNLGYTSEVARRFPWAGEKDASGS
jgi:sterol desaturase/sphingolipid hydroxylase (fatty acid hydroxylase superfamily)